MLLVLLHLRPTEGKGPHGAIQPLDLAHDVVIHAILLFAMGQAFASRAGEAEDAAAAAEAEARAAKQCQDEQAMVAAAARAQKELVESQLASAEVGIRGRTQLFM
jgi:hypothetical protein